MSDATEKTNAQINQRDSDREIESLLLGAARAVQRLVAERNELVGQLEVKDREVTLLQRQVMMIRDSYRRLTSEFVSGLQHIDTATTDILQEQSGATETPTRTDAEQDEGMSSQKLP